MDRVGYSFLEDRGSGRSQWRCGLSVQTYESGWTLPTETSLSSMMYEGLSSRPLNGKRRGKGRVDRKNVSEIESRNMKVCGVGQRGSSTPASEGLRRPSDFYLRDVSTDHGRSEPKRRGQTTLLHPIPRPRGTLRTDSEFWDGLRTVYSVGGGVALKLNLLVDTSVSLDSLFPVGRCYSVLLSLFGFLEALLFFVKVVQNGGCDTDQGPYREGIGPTRPSPTPNPHTESLHPVLGLRDIL